MASQSRKRELPDVARAEDSLEHRSKRRKPNGWFEVLGFETTAEGTVTHQFEKSGAKRRRLEGTAGAPHPSGSTNLTTEAPASTAQAAFTPQTAAAPEPAPAVLQAAETLITGAPPSQPQGGPTRARSVGRRKSYVPRALRRRSSHIPQQRQLAEPPVTPQRLSRVERQLRHVKETTQQELQRRLRGEGRRETDVTWQEGRWFAVALRIYSVETRAQGNKNACRSAYAARGKGGSRAAREARAQSAAQEEKKQLAEAASALDMLQSQSPAPASAQSQAPEPSQATAPADAQTAPLQSAIAPAPAVSQAPTQAPAQATAEAATQSGTAAHRAGSQANPCATDSISRDPGGPQLARMGLRPRSGCHAARAKGKSRAQEEEKQLAEAASALANLRSQSPAHAPAPTQASQPPQAPAPADAQMARLQSGTAPAPAVSHTPASEPAQTPAQAAAQPSTAAHHAGSQCAAQGNPCAAGSASRAPAVPQPARAGLRPRPGRQAAPSVGTPGTLLASEPAQDSALAALLAALQHSEPHPAMLAPAPAPQPVQGLSLAAMLAQPHGGVPPAHAPASARFLQRAQRATVTAAPAPFQQTQKPRTPGPAPEPSAEQRVQCTSPDKAEAALIRLQRAACVPQPTQRPTPAATEAAPQQGRRSLFRCVKALAKGLLYL